MGTIWSVFFGALAGTIIGTVIIIGAIAVWLYLTDPRRKRPPFTLGSIPESYLEEHIVKHFDTLFPGWRIFDDTPPDMANSDESRNPSGRQCHTKGGIIDLLCLDRQDSGASREIYQLDKRKHSPAWTASVGVDYCEILR